MSQRRILHVRAARTHALERIGRAAKREGLSRSQFITGILNDCEPVPPARLEAHEREQAVAWLREWFEREVVVAVDRVGAADVQRSLRAALATTRVSRLCGASAWRR